MALVRNRFDCDDPRVTQFRRFRHRAMATFFEAILPRTSGSEALCLAETLFEEIDRVESLHSRFDPVSEVSRVNRIAPQKPLCVSHELLQLLLACQTYWRETLGAFDPAGCRPNAPSGFGGIEIDEQERTVFFHHPDLSLDFGGVGKGYALACCSKLLKRLGIENLLLHGGTSSVLAQGEGPDGEGWRIGLRNSSAPDPRSFLDRVLLENRSLSSSGVFTTSQGQSDLIDPITKRSLENPTACTVIANDPLAAEILSTAFLVLGRSGTEGYLRQHPEDAIEVAWIAEIDSEFQSTWLEPGRRCA